MTDQKNEQIDERRMAYTEATNKLTMIKETRDKVDQLENRMLKLDDLIVRATNVKAEQGDILKTMRHEIDEIQLSIRALVRHVGIEENKKIDETKDQIRTEDFDKRTAQADEVHGMEPCMKAESGGAAIVSFKFLNKQNQETSIPRARIPLVDGKHELDFTRPYIEGMNVGEEKKVVHNGIDLTINLIGARRKRKNAEEKLEGVT